MEPTTPSSEGPARAQPPPGKEPDPLGWTTWAVLAALLLIGLLGFLGVFSSKKEGPTAADIPVPIPSDSAEPPGASAVPRPPLPLRLPRPEK